jgi:hypothetical protein
VLKLCRDRDNREILNPKQSLLDPGGVFLLRPDIQLDSNQETIPSGSNHSLYIWFGSKATERVVEIAKGLSQNFLAVLVPEEATIQIISEGNEPEEFWGFVLKDFSFSSSESVSFNDLYKESSFSMNNESELSNVNEMETDASKGTHRRSLEIKNENLESDTSEFDSNIDMMSENDNSNIDMIGENDNSNVEMIVENDKSSIDMIVENDNSNVEMIVENDNSKIDMIRKNLDLKNELSLNFAIIDQSCDSKKTNIIHSTDSEVTLKSSDTYPPGQVVEGLSSE